MSDTTFIAGTVIAADWLNDVNDAAYTKLANVTTISAAAATVLDDASVGAMLTTMGGAPLASPTFTGTVTLPSGTVGVTAAASDNDTSLATTAFVQQELTSQAVKLTGTQTIAGVKTFSSMPVLPTQSMIRLTGANGFGSTPGNKNRRFTTTVVSQGTDITYTNSTTDGASFTITEPGVYAITYVDSGNAATEVGLSLNSSQLTTAIGSITAADRLGGQTTGAASYIGAFTWIGYLADNSVIRPHSDGLPVGADNTSFTIVRVS